MKYHTLELGKLPEEFSAIPHMIDAYISKHDNDVSGHNAVKGYVEALCALNPNAEPTELPDGMGMRTVDAEVLMSIFYESFRASYGFNDKVMDWLHGVTLRAIDVRIHSSKIPVPNTDQVMQLTARQVLRDLYILCGMPLADGLEVPPVDDSNVITHIFPAKKP